MKPISFKSFWTQVTAVVILLAVTLIFSFTPPFHKANLWTWDYLFRLREEHPVSNDIVIVSVDDESFSMLDTQWPFPRGYYARMIENLEKAGVKQIIFDIEFTESSNINADNLLGSIAAQYDNIVWAGKVIREKKTSSVFRLLPPIAQIFRANAPWGMVNMSADVDGFIRNYPIYDEEADLRVYSLGIVALATEKGDSSWKDNIVREDGVLKVNDYRIPLNNSKRVAINYYGAEGTFKYYSFSSILDDENFLLPGFETEDFQINEFNQFLSEGVFKDKTVFVGVSTAELHDNFSTPFNYKKVTLPGVEIHANFLQMVKDGRFINEVGFGTVILLLFFIAIIMQIVNRLIKPQYSILITLLILIAVLIWSVYRFIQFNEIWQVVIFILYGLLSYTFNLVYTFISTAREKRFIKNAFQMYMAPEVVNELLKNPKSLTYGGSEQEITVLFSDIRSFTSYSESHPPETTVAILSEYLTAMVEVIKRHKGIVDKFVGDEIMALYGTPLKDEEHALNACRTALEMRDVLDRLHREWQKEGRDIFEIGIGINTGKAVVGNLGSEQIFDYTAIGDNINLGARLEAINKEYKTQKKIIISEYTLEVVKDKVVVDYLDEIKVKGKNIPVKIYELIAVRR